MSDTEVRTKWVHRKGDRYLVVRCYYVGNPDQGYWQEREIPEGPLPTRRRAWQFGIREFGHDDFNIAVIRNGELHAWLWDDEIIDEDVETLCEIETEIRWATL